MHFHLIEWMKILATFLTTDTNNSYDSSRYRHLYNVTKYSFILMNIYLIFYGKACILTVPADEKWQWQRCC